MAGPVLRCCVALATAAAAAGAVSAQTSFEVPQNVSQTPGNSFLPSLVVDPSGNSARLFWHDFSSVPNLMQCCERTGTSWSASQPCAANLTQSWEAAAASDSQGHVHLVWRDRTLGRDDVYYSKYDGLVWSPPENLSNSSGRSSSPAIVLDGQDHPHVLWKDDTTGADAFYESHHDGAVWSGPGDTGIPLLQPAALKPISLACDSTDTLHAVWHDGATSVTEVYHAERPPGGPWGAPEAVSGTASELSAEPCIALGPADTLHCVWVEQEPSTGMTFEVVYATKPKAGLWSAAQDVSRQGGSTFNPVIAVHPADESVHIAWMLDGPGDIYYVDGPASTPVNVSKSGYQSERPCLALDSQARAYLAWEEGVPGNREIFFAAGKSAAIVLLAAPDRSLSDVVLEWQGGLAPFAVGWSLLPDVAANWSDLTPPGGIGDSRWVDAGVLGDGNTYYYMVEELR